MPMWLSQIIQAGLPQVNFGSLRRRSLRRRSRSRSRSATRLVVREPVGVVGCITPWNYPLHQIVGKVGAGAGRRLHGRAQAERGRAAQRVHPGRDHRRGRPARRRVQPRHRHRSGGRRGHRRPPRRRHGVASPAPPAPASGSPSWRRRRSSGSRSSSAASRPTSSSTTPTSRQAVARRRRQVLPQLGPDLHRARPACSCRAAKLDEAAAIAADGGRDRSPSAIRSSGPARIGPLVVRRRSATASAATSRRASTRAPSSSTGGADEPEGLDKGYYVQPDRVLRRHATT